MHIVNLTPVKNLLRYIFKMGVNRKFDFRWVWKFCWDLSNVISGGNWVFRWDCVFSGGTLYPSANYASCISYTACISKFVKFFLIVFSFRKSTNFIIWLKENFWYKWLDEVYMQGRSLCMYSVIYLSNCSLPDGTDAINQLTERKFCFTELVFIFSSLHVEIIENDWRFYFRCVTSYFITSLSLQSLMKSWDC